MRVLCLLSYLWDTLPKCVEDPDDDDYYEYDTNQISCPNTYPTPKNYDRSNVEYNLIQSEQKSNYFKQGSKIIYQCFPGYYINNSITSQTTYCDNNGQWTKVLDCEPHSCYGKLPRRPLNGKREAGLTMGRGGFSSSSYVKFTCNQFFERIGKEVSYCVNNEWEKEIPECRLMKNICTVKPRMQDEFSYLKSLTRVESKIELDYKRTEKLIVYTIANYVCQPGFRFEDETNLQIRHIAGIPWIYKNVTCIGQNIWSPIPKCVQKFS